MSTIQDVEESIAHLDSLIREASLELMPYFAGWIERLRTTIQLQVQTCRAEALKPAQTDQYLTVEQVATRLNVQKSFVYETARQGRLKKIQLGKYIRFTEEAVRNYMNNYAS